MAATPKVEDAAARERALDTTTSFITQAPAGSGKTGLLTQRYLRLLAQVNAPEEIVAITFTRKAAGEMQARILEALASAASDTVPTDAHEAKTWAFARAALARDAELDWQLPNNPSRLRVQTIDSLCASLARQMPLLSRFGAAPATVEDARPLYIEAARHTIAELESGEDWSEAIAHLVRHLDNRLDYLQGLIATMLARRDQWLRQVADRSHPRMERSNLEAALRRMVEEGLTETRSALLAATDLSSLRDHLLPLLHYAAANLAATDSPIAACAILDDWPAARVDRRQQWQGLATLLVTNDGQWRKKVDKRQGFPAPGDGEDAAQKALFKQRKTQMTELLQGLAEQDGLRALLAAIAKLPPHAYRDEEWETLQALFELLRLAAAQLELVFRARGQVDFSAMAQAASQALGEPEAPTDLALALDYRIQHLLVDEFQDTSFSQHELLQGLTAGWQAGDGRTLFVVGDPMQSIYRFREAEVGLFLEARKQGLGGLPLESLQLTVNFRSQAGIVDWVNARFPRVLPERERIADGAVPYAPSVAFRAPLPETAVSVYPYLGKQTAAEAEQVVRIIQTARTRHPQGTVAVLVRGRNHLVEIVAALKAARLRFRAVEIERLAHRPVIQDLLALTRALEHPADRIAWLAVLRAPWCGLSLADLHVLAGDDHALTLEERLQAWSTLGGLSEDGRQRLARVWPCLQAAVQQRQRNSLRVSVEGSWLSLGGPACVREETDLEDAEVFFQLLEHLEENASAITGAELEQQLTKLFALPDAQADDGVQLMTIHKSKGLEFDTVIVPGLGRLPRRDDAALLSCMERPREPEGSDLLLAPIKEAGADTDAIAAHLNRLTARKAKYEDGRLLYVAATRAKRFLHLLGHVEFKEQDGDPRIKTPREDTLLASLWPVLAADFQAALAQRPPSASEDAEQESILPPATPRLRLPADWQVPAAPAALSLEMPEPAPKGEALLEFSWASESARHVGTVVHQFLQHFSEAGLPDADVAGRYRGQVRQRLQASAIPEALVDAAVSRVLQALETIVSDPRGRWMLDAGHQDARSEYALSGPLYGRVQHMVMDRTFIDEQGVRWIIDYKTGSHSGGGLEEFLDREQERYARQLHGYAIMMRRMEDRPIRLGLYFPMMAAWREWGFEGGEEAPMSGDE